MQNFLPSSHSSFEAIAFIPQSSYAKQEAFFRLPNETQKPFFSKAMQPGLIRLSQALLSVQQSIGAVFWRINLLYEEAARMEGEDQMD